MALPDWELDIAHTALTRNRSVVGHGLVVHDLRVDTEDGAQDAARAQEQAARQAAGAVDQARPVPEPAADRTPVIRWPGLRPPGGRHAGHTPEEPRR